MEQPSSPESVSTLDIAVDEVNFFVREEKTPSIEDLLFMLTTRIDCSLVKQFCLAYRLFLTPGAFATLLMTKLESSFKLDTENHHRELTKVRIHVIIRTWAMLCSNVDFDTSVKEIILSTILRIRNSQTSYLASDPESNNQLPKRLYKKTLTCEDRQILNEIIEAIVPSSNLKSGAEDPDGDPHQTRNYFNPSNRSGKKKTKSIFKLPISLFFNYFGLRFNRSQNRLKISSPHDATVSSPKDQRTTFWSANSSRKIAEQLCIVESQILSRADWLDLINHGRPNHRLGKSLIQAIDHFSEMSRWLMSEILQHPRSLGDRIQAVIKMIRVADVSFCSYDFHFFFI